MTKEEKQELITKIKELTDAYWRFDSFQEPRSTWHEKQDFLKAIEKAVEIYNSKQQ